MTALPVEDEREGLFPDSVTTKAMLNPIEQLPAEIDGDFRFSTVPDEQVSEIRGIDLLNAIQVLSEENRFLGVKTGRELNVTQAFFTAADNKKAFHVDVEFQGYRRIIAHNPNSDTLPKTAAGFLSDARFQTVCALLGFARVQSRDGSYIEPSLTSHPVLKP